MQTNCVEAEPAPDLLQARCRFGLLIGSVYRQWRKKVDDTFKAQGLTDATRMPLVVLLTHGQAMRQKDLAHSLSLDTSSLVRVLTQLRNAQLVQWRIDPADRRAKCIELTVQGRQVAADILQTSLNIEQAILADLTPQELELTRRALHKITQTFERMDGIST